MLKEIDHENGAQQAGLETISAHKEGGVLFAEIAAPPMNLLGPELVRDLVSLIQQTEADDSIRVLVFKSADPDYFISHVDVTRIAEYAGLASETHRRIFARDALSLSQREPLDHDCADRRSRTRCGQRVCLGM